MSEFELLAQDLLSNNSSVLLTVITVLITKRKTSSFFGSFCDCRDRYHLNVLHLGGINDLHRKGSKR